MSGDISTAKLPGAPHRPHSEYRGGKDIANYKHSHSAQKDVYVEGCQRCDFLIAKKSKEKNK